MPSSCTQNYQLNQWSADDQVCRADFNADNAKIDAALKAEADARTAGDAALQTAVNAKADASALAALTQTVNTKADVSALAALTQTVNTKADASALSALQTAVNGKAAQSALTALQTVVAGKGNCQVVYGQYTGNGLDVKTNPITLTFNKKPLLVIIADTYPLIAVRGAERGVKITNGSSSVNTITWGEKSLTWTTSDSYGVTLNAEGVVYHYVAFLEA